MDTKSKFPVVLVLTGILAGSLQGCEERDDNAAAVDVDEAWDDLDPRERRDFLEREFNESIAELEAADRTDESRSIAKSRLISSVSLLRVELWKTERGLFSDYERRAKDALRRE